MTTKTARNHIHKIRALLAKTTANGCTPGEAASALSLASTMITKHGLNPADFIWPDPPAGWRWGGVRGHGGTVVEAPAEKPKRKQKAKAEPSPEREPARITNGERLASLAARPDGFTIDDITAMLGILPHTARALISVELRKRRGLKVEIDRETRRYSIVRG